MTDGVPSFPYAPYSIVDDKGHPNPEPTKPGVAVVDESRRLAKDLTKLAKVKIKMPKMKTPKTRRKLDPRQTRYY